MDQGFFVELGHQRLDGINPDEAPLSVEHYLKQVQVDRLRRQEVVVANIDTNQFRARQTESYKHEDSLTTSAALAPPMEWQQAQLAEFSELRHGLVTLRARLQKEKRLGKFNFPDPEDEDGWRTFCQKKFSKQLDRNSLLQEGRALDLLKKHEGTPPLLGIVLAMSQPSVVQLLEYHTEWFAEDGHSRPLMEWIFALLSVLEKPIDPETCACLRDLARGCRDGREKLEASDPLVREFSWFICTVGRYFNQTDLADNFSEEKQ